MKTIFKTTLLLFLTTLVMGCSGKDDSIAGNNGADTYLTAKVNGSDFKSSVEIVAFRAPIVGEKYGAYITTADNFGDPEYEFVFLNEVHEKDKPDVKWREGYVELENADGKTDAWKIPRDFNFTITKETSTTLEGTFSFVATPAFGKDLETLTITDGKYKANKKSY